MIHWLQNLIQLIHAITKTGPLMTGKPVKSSLAERVGFEPTEPLRTAHTDFEFHKVDYYVSLSFS